MEISLCPRSTLKPTIIQPIIYKVSIRICNQQFRSVNTSKKHRAKLGNETKKEREILIEKAFFKSKFLFHASWFLLLVYALILIIASLYKPSVYTILWAAIYSATFIVVVSKYRNTVLILKILAGFAISTLVVQYILHFSTQYYFNFIEELISLIKEDYKAIILFLLILFFSDDLIERRLVKKKTRQKTSHDS